jgi:transglycosylase-like protein with SLT domain
VTAAQSPTRAPSTRLLRAAAVLALAVLAVFATLLGGLPGVSTVAPAVASAPSEFALADIPAEMLVLYRKAGQRYQLDWAILAAIGSIESDHGRSTASGVHAGVNFAGCCAGPMQFDITDEGGNTWAAYGVDGNNDGSTNVYDPADAIPAAARYLRDHGAPADYRRAIYAYNHADWYVSDVLARAAAYRKAAAAARTTGSPSYDVGDVLHNPRILLTDIQRADLASGAIDARVVGVLALIGRTHAILVTALKSDHSYLTANRTVSNHAYGRAVDISAVDGESCTGTTIGRCGQLALGLAQLQGPLHSTELIYCFDADGPASPDAFARADHCRHIHIGYDA